MIGTFWTTIGAISVVALFYIYWYISKKENYWKERGFHHITSKELGTTILSAFKNTHVTKVDAKVYNILKSKQQSFAGIMEFTTPVFFVKDLELVRHIFVKDFDHFVDHRGFGQDYWSEKMLFFMRGDPWKLMRTKMTPTFTTGKIRRMFVIIENCGQRLIVFLQSKIEVNSTVDFIEAYGKYTADVISSAAFGLESGAFREKKSVFEKMGEKLAFTFSVKQIVQPLILLHAPIVAKWMKLTIFDTLACKFFQETIQRAIQHRQSSGQKKEDFLQIMLEARAGQLKTDETELSAFEKEAVVGNLGKGIVDLSDMT